MPDLAEIPDVDTFKWALILLVGTALGVGIAYAYRSTLGNWIDAKVNSMLMKNATPQMAVQTTIDPATGHAYYPIGVAGYDQGGL